MNVTSVVRSELRRIMLTVAGLPTVQWEGKKFTPAADQPYIRERLDPISTTTESIGNDGSQQQRYTYSLDLFWPLTGFISDAENLVDLIRGTYWVNRGISLVSGTKPICGWIIQPETRPLLEGETFTQFPIRISLFVRYPGSPF